MLSAVDGSFHVKQMSRKISLRWNSQIESSNCMKLQCKCMLFILPLIILFHNSSIYARTSKNTLFNSHNLLRWCKMIRCGYDQSFFFHSAWQKENRYSLFPVHIWLYCLTVKIVFFVHAKQYKKFKKRKRRENLAIPHNAFLYWRPIFVLNDPFSKQWSILRCPTLFFYWANLFSSTVIKKSFFFCLDNHCIPNQWEARVVSICF